MLGCVKKGMPYIGLILLLVLIIFSVYSSEGNRRNEQNLKQDPLEMAHCVCQRCQVGGMKARFAKNARQHRKLDVEMVVLLRKLNSPCLLVCTTKNSFEEEGGSGLTSNLGGDEIGCSASLTEMRGKMEQLAGAYDDVAYEYIAILKNVSQGPNFNPPTGLDENRKAAQQNALWLKTEVLCGCEDNHAAR